MTAIIGFCLKEGAFLAADSCRTDLITNQPVPELIRKIENLIPGIVIATGGLGDVGHLARNELIANVKDDYDLHTILNLSSQIFNRHYEESFKLFPNHNVYLSYILAGRDPLTGEGFITISKSSNSFEPSWIKGYGKPLFTGSNTSLLIEIASQGIHQLKNNSQKLPLDFWAIETINQIGARDSTIALPGQLVLAGKLNADKFPVYRNNLLEDNRFSVDFPNFLR